MQVVIYVQSQRHLIELSHTIRGKQDALRMNQELEKLISVQLPQYMWGMKIFKNRAEGQADLYS